MATVKHMKVTHPLPSWSQCLSIGSSLGGKKLIWTPTHAGKSKINKLGLVITSEGTFVFFTAFL
jgi:hypothetical protein